MHLFEGNTADEVWQKAATALSDTTRSHEQESRAGMTRELIGAAFTIANPRQRWVTSRWPAINPAFAIAEVVWIVSGRRDSAFLNYWNPKLPQFAGTGKQYHGAYGFRLRKHHGVDQLERAYRALRENPESRQVVLQIWDAQVDFPQEDGRPANQDIPCNICSFAKIRDGKLEWTQVLRSNDLFLGVPHNFVQFTSLQEILAAWLNLDVGHYRHIADCLHIYTRDEENAAKSRHTNPASNDDRLCFTKAESDLLFAEMEARMDKMTSNWLSARKLGQLARAEAFPIAMQNWLLVVAADAARRHKWVDLSMELMMECSNPALKQLWDGWFNRWWHLRTEEMVSSDAALHAQLCLPLRFAH